VIFGANLSHIEATNVITGVQLLKTLQIISLILVIMKIYFQDWDGHDDRRLMSET
jgi:hypothetical protein